MEKEKEEKSSKSENRLDIIHRQWNILRLLDVEPNYTTIKKIKESLEKDYKVSTKTIKRDLIVLATYFDIFHENNKIAYTKEGIKPFITSDSAFVFNLSKNILENILPKSAINIIAPYFKPTRNTIKNSESLKQLISKVEVIYNSPLNPPKISEKILESIYESVLKEYKVEIKYFKHGWEKPKKYVLNSIGIVIKDQNVYFVCQDDVKEFIKYLPVQRIKEIKILNEKSNIPENFNLKEYAEKNIQRWDIDDDSELIDFKAEFDKGIAFMVKETPISKDQKITKKDDGNIIVEAKIPDSVHLRTFLLSLGDQVKIVKPKVLREFFKETALSLANMYRV